MCMSKICFGSLLKHKEMGLKAVLKKLYYGTNIVTCFSITHLSTWTSTFYIFSLDNWPMNDDLKFYKLYKEQLKFI